MHAAARRLFHGLRTEGSGPGREAAAVGIGIFIGCLPFFGFHLLLCWVAGWALRLNRLKVYLAANISNPVFAPTLIFSELQAGAWLRRGAFHPLTIDAVKTTDLSVFGLDLLAGSVVIGAALGALLAAATLATLRGTDRDAAFLDLVREASDRYILSSIRAWEFARGKLRADPLYRATVCDGVLPSGGTLVDIGCGGGLSLAILADAAGRFRAGQWPATWNPPPFFDRMIGVERRPRAARIAREALGDAADIRHADARALAFERCRAVLLFDVLHMIPADAQDTLIAGVAAAIEPGGVVLVREADPAGGWRFLAVRCGNRMKALASGHWSQRFHFRTRDEWLVRFAAHGLTGEVWPMREGTPFANVLFRVTAPADASATSRPPSPAV